MKIDIPEYLIEMVLDWKDREKEHNSLGQIGQADDCYSFNNYQKTVLNDLFEIFKNIDVIQKQYQISQELKLARNSLKEAKQNYEFYKNKVKNLEGQLIYES